MSRSLPFWRTKPRDMQGPLRGYWCAKLVNYGFPRRPVQVEVELNEPFFSGYDGLWVGVRNETARQGRRKDVGALPVLRRGRSGRRLDLPPLRQRPENSGISDA